MPSLTSGRPILALLDMTRKSAARHISRPPPRAMPLIAATVGTARSSKSLKILLASRLAATNSASGNLKLSTNSVMSAPTINFEVDPDNAQLESEHRKGHGPDQQGTEQR